jgi:outer membrane protein assembly factor BamB
MSDAIYEGKLLTCGYGGVLIAYNITTGQKLWSYTARTEGFESPYGNYPMGIGAIADGKIYIGAGEHSPTQPIWRGSVLQCIDANTGELIWNYPAYGVSMPSGNAGYNFAIADGYLVTLNAYDNQIYCFGKGPSATTVSAPQTAVSPGTKVLITGTVTDQTPTPEAQGKPAISDADQTEWMKYLYSQQPLPENAKGVEVYLTAIDPNGNFQEIGTATTNVLGNYAIAWTPPVPGLYTVKAVFEGSNSYYGSQAGAAFVVGEQTAPIVQPTPTTPGQTITPTQPVQTPTQSVSPSATIVPLPPSSGTPTTTYLIIGAAVVIIVAAAAALVLRKRKA